MQAPRSLQMCARRTLSQPTRHLLSSRNYQTPNIFQPTARYACAVSRRQFSSSPQSYQSEPQDKPKPRPASSFPAAFRELLKEHRSSRAAKTGGSVATQMDALIGRSSTNASDRPRRSQGLDRDMMDKLAGEVDHGPSISLRLRPTLGRTVDGLFGDPTRGFRTLDRKCAENRVKADARAQQTHVRRGQRRKLLRSERWRKLFKEGFKAELNTLKRMRKQGW